MTMIVFVASEATPFIKTGGLADVVGSLPLALNKRFKVITILPKYQALATLKLSDCGHFYIDYDQRSVYVGVEKLTNSQQEIYFIDNQEMFGYDFIYGDDYYLDIKRFAYFSKAALAALKFLGLPADIIHCHDWQTSLIAMYLKTQFRFDSFYSKMKCLLTIHNLHFQGSYDAKTLARLTHLNVNDFPFNSSLLASGIVYSDWVNTVSTNYAKEIQTPFFGENLNSYLLGISDHLSGIINGIDYTYFNPHTDKNIYKNYSTYNFNKGKAINKKYLQEKFNLPIAGNRFLIGIISRLTQQKGFDLVMCVLEEMLINDNVQFIVLGTGEEKYETFFAKMQQKYPHKLATHLAYSEKIAHLIYAGSDALLMPSLFEPCGLAQMIAMRYGSLPIVRETGGLKDSVVAYNEYLEEGNGFSFANYNAHEMMAIIRYAEKIYYESERSFKKMIKRAMLCDFSWQNSSKQYEQLYKKLKEK